jgi:hypothetical protein
METLLWILLPGLIAVASGVLAWFIMQSRMDVAIARERELLAEARGTLEAQKSAMRDTLHTAVRAAEESARRVALEQFLDELRVEQRHYTRDHRLTPSKCCRLVLQERMFFRNIPLCDWIEHEIVLDPSTDIERVVETMTVFDKTVINISEGNRQKVLA